MYRVPLVFTPQPEGGYTVTSPVLPELLTEGDTLEESRPTSVMRSRRLSSCTLTRGAVAGKHVVAWAKRHYLVRNFGGQSMTYREVARKLAALGCKEIVSGSRFSSQMAESRDEPLDGGAGLG